MKIFLLFILIPLTIGCNFSNKNNRSLKKYTYKTTVALKELDNKHYLLSIKLFKNIKCTLNDSLYSFINYKIGCCFEKLNMLDSAEFYYTKALNSARMKKERFSSDLADCYNVKALMYISKYHDLYAAKLYYDSVLYVSSKCQNLDSASFAWNLFNIGYYYHYKGLYQNAEKYYSQAYNIFSKLNDCKEKLETVSYYQADIYCFLEKYDIAQTKIDQAINYYLNKNVPGTLKDLYYEKAYLYFLKKDFKKPIIFYKKALQISETNHLKNKEIILNSIAWCYLNLKMLDSSEFYFKKCFPLIDTKTDINTIISLYGEYSKLLILKNNSYASLQIINKRLPYVKKILGNKNSLYSYFLLQQGHSLESLNRLDESLAVYQDVIKSSVTTNLKQNLFKIPEFSLNELTAHEYAITAIIGKGDIFTKLAFTKENSYRKNFLLQCAFEHYQKARELVEIYNKNIVSESDRLQFTSSNSNAFSLELQSAIRLYYSTGNAIFLEKAFLSADRNKASQLTFGLKDDEFKKLGGIPDSIIKKVNYLQEEISLFRSYIQDVQKKAHPDLTQIQWLIENLNLLMDESESMSKNINNIYPNYYKLKYSSNNLNTDSLKKLINFNKTLIEYAFSGDSLYTFVLNSKKLKIFSQSSKGLEDSIKSFRDFNHIIALDNKKSNLKIYINKAYWLYNKLIKSMEPYLTENLIIVPDGYINLIPFESLVTSENLPDHSESRLLPYLLYKYCVSYTYSASLFNIQQNIKSIRTNKVLAFAPIYKNNKYFELIDSRQEVKNIVNIFNGKAITDRKATKEYFKKHTADGSILHLAMHAQIDNEFPMNSKLIFSDSYLSNYEIYNLNLRSPLVVLSACSTGGGKLMKGEGIISLARGFMHAGCTSMLMTIWDVPDQSSSELMQLFYKNLKKGYCIDKSLQKAKIQYIENSDNNFALPYYWAGYIQTGKTEAILPVVISNKTKCNKIIILSVSFLIISTFIIIKRALKH
jgi:CHAT domain-containing protein/tetratricopeptide (TPR) repeat protein